MPRVFSAGATYGFHAARPPFIRSDVRINHTFVRTQEGGCVVFRITGEELKQAWHDDLIDQRSCSDQCVDAYFEALCSYKKEKIYIYKKKKSPLKRFTYATDGISPQVLHAEKPKIYQSAKEQMNPSWPREIFMLIGFQAQPLHWLFPTSIIWLSLPLWLSKPWGSDWDPQRSEVTCFTPGHAKPTQWQVLQVTNYALGVGNHDPDCL